MKYPTKHPLFPELSQMGTSPSPPILNIQPPSHTPTNQLASINQKSVKKLIKKKNHLSSSSTSSWIACCCDSKGDEDWDGAAENWRSSAWGGSSWNFSNLARVVGWERVVWRETAPDPPRIEAGKDKEKWVGEVELGSGALQKQLKLGKEEEEEAMILLLSYPHTVTLIVGIGWLGLTTCLLLLEYSIISFIYIIWKMKRCKYKYNLFPIEIHF